MPIKPPAKKKRTNSASAANGRLGGKPEKENLLEGFKNLDTGVEVQTPISPYFPSMKAAAHALKIDIAILRDARGRDCPAFGSSGAVHRERLLKWLKQQNELPKQEAARPSESDEGLTNFTDSYDIPEDAGGVGQSLKSLQAYERRAKFKLDQVEKADLHPVTKAELVKVLHDTWIKTLNALLKYDLSVSMAKRESGELIPQADAIAGVHALLAWHTVAMSDALRNVIPDCEGKNKYEIATLLDTAIRSSIYRNFKMGMKLNKLPEWMGTAANEFVKNEKPLKTILTVDDI